jgi:hypothetical protein
MNADVDGMRGKGSKVGDIAAEDAASRLGCRNDEGVYR